MLRGLSSRPRSAEGASLPLPPVSWSAIRASDRFDLVVCGVGKANAAGATALAFDPVAHAGVLNLGVAGSLPGSIAAMAQVVLSNFSLYADEGVLTAEGFTDVAAMGFPPDQDAAGSRGSIGVAPAPDLLDAIRPLTDHAGPVATVSTCSGTDAMALDLERRTNAIAEAMEGAAIGFTCLRLARQGESVRFAEARVISNTTGDRARQRWDLKGALDRLASLVSSL